MKLIREYLGFDEVEIIKEALEGGKQNYFIVGPYLQAELTNKNKRRYPMDVMETEVNRYTKEYIDRKRGYGELGHPATPTINLDRASHLVMELKRDGNNFIGRSKILTTTPMGHIAKSLLDEGCQLAVSSRGLGTLVPTAEGINIVQKNFRLATPADIVADPSAPDAFVQGVMESAEWVYVDGQGYVEQHVEQLRKNMRTQTVAQINEEKVANFQAFLNKLVRG